MAINFANPLSQIPIGDEYNTQLGPMPGQMPYGGMTPGNALGGGLTDIDPATGMPRGYMPEQQMGFDQGFNLPGGMPSLPEQPKFPTLNQNPAFNPTIGTPAPQITTPVTQQPLSNQIANIGAGQQNLVQMLGPNAQPQAVGQVPQPQPQPQPQKINYPGQTFGPNDLSMPGPQPQPQPTLRANPAFNQPPPRPAMNVSRNLPPMTPMSLPVPQSRPLPQPVLRANPAFNQPGPRPAAVNPNIMSLQQLLATQNNRMQTAPLLARPQLRAVPTRMPLQSRPGPAPRR